MSRTFSIRSGSVDSLKLSLRCGRKPNARQIRATLLRLRPTRFARDRVLQCVASLGLLSRSRTPFGLPRLSLEDAATRLQATLGSSRAPKRRARVAPEAP
jgi:hypothetical protein